MNRKGALESVNDSQGQIKFALKVVSNRKSHPRRLLLLASVQEDAAGFLIMSKRTRKMVFNMIDLNLSIRRPWIQFERKQKTKALGSYRECFVVPHLDQKEGQISQNLEVVLQLLRRGRKKDCH